MRIDALSTFPSMLDAVMGTSIMGRACSRGLVSFHAHDLRQWTHDRHRTTDDDPYGGGPGLIMKCEPIFDAHEAIVEQILEQQRLEGRATAEPLTIFTAPSGERLDDRLACELASEEALIFVCGHYEGIDERAYRLADRVISLGDYVLTSGELASLVIIDAVVRKLPGVLGNAEGAEDESFVHGLLEYPQYTRPALYRGMEVPAVLLSGDHGAIATWRRRQALWRTLQWRPDLLEHAALSDEDQRWLEEAAPLGNPESSET